MEVERTRDFQALLSSQGWVLFKGLVLTDKQEGKWRRPCLHSQLQASLNAAVRANDMVRASYFQGQIDLIPVILRLPEREYEKTKSPNPKLVNGAGQ